MKFVKEEKTQIVSGIFYMLFFIVPWIGGCILILQVFEQPQNWMSTGHLNVEAKLALMMLVFYQILIALEIFFFHWSPFFPLIVVAEFALYASYITVCSITLNTIIIIILASLCVSKLMYTWANLRSYFYFENIHTENSMLSSIENGRVKMGYSSIQ